MSANYPILPLGGSIPVVALLTHWLKELAKARRHRREASVLAGVDQRMLADIGITRSDMRDAFSEPFWDDPTALLRERALERRLNRVRRAESTPIRNPRRPDPAPVGPFRRAFTV